MKPKVRLLHTRWVTLRARPQRGAGGESLELIIVAPVLLLIIVLGIAGGRYEIGTGKVDQAASVAARAASQQRDPQAAQRAASEAARSSLAQAGASCENMTVSVDTSGFTVPRGQLGFLTATVSCVVQWSDLSLPGLPGSRTVTSSAVSSLDVNRERARGAS